MKQIAVIGLGSFGTNLARKLSELGTSVVVIDSSEARIDRIKAYVDKAILGDASDPRLFRELGLERMDTVVLSLGDELDASVLAALHLKELGAKNIVAKVASEDHEKIVKLIGAEATVFPERDMAVRLANSLSGQNIAEYLPLGPDLSLMEIKPLSSMVGKTIAELNFREKYRCQIVAIHESAGARRVFIPQPGTVIREDHLLFIIGANEDVDSLGSRAQKE